MTKQLFKRVAAATDLHFGNKHNSRIFNGDVEDFITWFIEEAEKRKCETCVILGDWHHARNSINVSTLNYTVSNIGRLAEAFDSVYVLAGNHDLFYREKREIHSLPMANAHSNVHIVDEPFTDGNVTFVPWLVEDEWRKVTKIKSKYMFGHFEIPGFKMNAMIEMPDHGGINQSHFKHQDYVFSGHFHKRQWKDNIHYIGNPFGHNYGDAGDKERGAMFLEWGDKPEYVNYEDGPKYVSTDLGALIDTPERFLKGKTYIKVALDVDISYEEATFIKETFMSNHDIREFKLVQQKFDEVSDDANADIKFETVDQIVIDQLNAIESDNFKKETLIEIYNRL